MLQIAERIREISGVDANALPDDVLGSAEPLVLRGVVAHWPVVKAARESNAAADAYLRRFYKDATVGAMLGGPAEKGRMFYNEDLTGFNFKMVKIKLDTVLDELKHYEYDPVPPTLYVGSTTVDTCLPGFRAENDLNFGKHAPLASIWIGNRARIAAHHDLPDNLACVAIGHRRFTLFPPEQVENLYVGPLDFTPAGQSISLVDFANPDYSRFPKFAEAVKAARVAELEPGDALFIPSMWWHHIESLDPLNALVNYWWRTTPSYLDSPFPTLIHAIMTLRALPERERAPWERLFRHYVFEATDETFAHIPPERRGVLGPIDANQVREMRAFLLQRLNR